MLGYNEAWGILENHWMADSAARYIDAWFANLNWETVAARA